MGISDKIQPSRFRAIRLGIVSDKNEAQPLFGFSLDEELVDNKYDLKLTWPRTKHHYTPKGGYDLQATEKYKKEREEKYLDAFKEIIKDYLKKIKDFYIKKPILILDEDYNLITNPDDILIKIFGENWRGDEIILSEFKWSEL